MNLSSEQNRAIESPVAHKKVLAGAGSGKTRLLVAQVGAWLEQGVKSDQVAVVTFTRRAAESLRRRISQEYNAVLGYVGTVHGMAYLAMALAGKPITPLTDQETDSVVEYIAQICRLQRSISPKVLKAARGEQVQKLNSGELALRGAVAAYMQAMRIIHVGQLLDVFRWQMGHLIDLRHYVQAKTAAVAWDEYQDTTALEDGLWDCFAPSHSFIVGDPRQAIYGFRGSSSRYLLTRPAAPFNLSFNYRSSQLIIEAANGLHLPGPDLIPFRETFGNYATSVNDNSRMMADHTAAVIAQDVPKPCVVLCRTNHELRQVHDALQALGVSAVIASPGFDQYADPPWSDLFVVVRYVLDGTCEWATGRLKTLGINPELFWTCDPFYTTAGELLASYSPEQATALADNPALSMSLADFAVWYQRRDLESIMPASWEQDVVCMTAHASKGLEFKSVVLHNVGGTLRNDPANEDERNLLYVAVTRAQDSLVEVRTTRRQQP